MLPSAALIMEHFDRHGTRIYGSRYSPEDTQTAGVKRDQLSKAGAIIPNSACWITANQAAVLGRSTPSGADEHQFNGGSCYTGPHETVAEGDRTRACPRPDGVTTWQVKLCERRHQMALLLLGVEQRTPTMEEAG